MIKTIWAKERHTSYYSTVLYIEKSLVIHMDLMILNI